MGYSKKMEKYYNNPTFYKGEEENIRNYRPICLFSILYKILMKVLKNH